MPLERTLTIIKPDAVEAGHIGDIIKIFEANRFTIVAAKLVNLTKKEAEGFYAVHRARPFFGSLTAFMSSGRALVMVLEGENVIARLREVMGATNPAQALPGTIRKLYASNIERNCVHGSDAPETSAFEIGYFFPGLERPWQGIIGQGFTADDFDGYVSTVSLVSWQPEFIVLHNTAIPTLSDWHSVPGEVRMRNLESYYRDELHWSAGPHLFVADDLIWVFTPLNVPGVHSPSWNSISWGVEVVGNYAVEWFDSAVRDNAMSALASLHAIVGLDPNTLRLHKEDPKTTHDCPGKNIIKAEVIQGILDRLASRPTG